MSSILREVLEGFSIKVGLERHGIHMATKGERAKEPDVRVWEWVRKLKIV